MKKLKSIIPIIVLLWGIVIVTFGQVSSKMDSSLINPDYVMLSTDEQEQLAASDTLAGIQHLLEQARMFSSEGNYAKAYDTYWEALIVAHQLDDCKYIPSLNNGLGILYSVFEMDEEAEAYFNASLHYLKPKEHKTKEDFSMLRNTYYILASHHRENGNNRIAQAYIDSCNMILKHSPSLVSNLLADSEQAYVYLNQRKYTKAIKILEKVEPEVIKHIPSYRVVLYSMMGEIYYSLNEDKKSEQYLLNSLAIFELNNTHQNYIPDIYQKISDLYFKIGRLREAHRYLQTSKDKTEELFGVRSAKNRDLLEVKDAFRLERERQVHLLEKAHMHDLEQSEKILHLRNLILTLLFVSLIIISFIIYLYLQKQRKLEQYKFEQKQKLSTEKNTEILEFKNKELTSSALQIIQKDELILGIKERLINLKGIDKHALNKILTTIKVNKIQDWSEFEARFLSVNSHFYETLNIKYPTLTHKDHKLCALLKLNFSSKEISQLLGISTHSVISARYRLRKKMHLRKEEDLLEIMLAL